MFARGPKKIVLCFILMAAAYGCAPATAPVAETPIPYPPPPEDPKIVYLKSYRGEADFQKKSWLDSLFGAPAIAPMKQPYGVFAAGGRIYVTLPLGYVMAIDPKERKVDRIGEMGNGKLSLPLGVAISAEGMVFVSDAKLKKVFGYDSKGALKATIGKKGEFLNPAGLAINNELGRLYVVDSHAHMVRAYSTNGEPLFQFGSQGSGNGQFNYPSNVAVDKKSGKVYVSDTQNFRVQAFDKDGKYLMQWGAAGDQPGSFARPRGIGVDSEGNVYVADAAFGNFQVFNEKGELLLFVGAPGGDPGYFELPAGLYVDEQDRIFVVDSFNSRVQVFQYLSDQWKKEHPEEYDKYLRPDQQQTTGQAPKP